MSPEISSRCGSTSEAWARLRFVIVGRLLSSPPPRGELKHEIKALSRRAWLHPVTGQETRFAFSTIETWFYRARKEPSDPFGVLRRTRRKDFGTWIAVDDDLKKAILAQYKKHKDWSYKLHYGNLVALVEEQPELAPMPSYATIRCRATITSPH